MVLEQSLRNTGSKPIVTDMYDHNFFVIDGLTPEPDFAKPIDEGQRALTPLTGFGSTAKDYDIRVTNCKTGAAVRVTADVPLTRLVFWTVHTVLSPEAYMHLNVAPGQESKWRIQYEFSAGARTN